MHAELRSQLEQSILGEHLSPQSLAGVIAMGRAMTVAPGSCLFREGEQNPDVFLLLAGRIDLSMTVPGRGPCRILTLGPGELIAWSAVVGNGTMTCTAMCLEECRLIAIRSALLETAIADDRRLGYEFMKMMASALARRLLATRLQLLDLFRHPA